MFYARVSAGEQEFLQDHHPLPPPSKQVRAWELLKYSDKALYRRAKPSQLPPDSFQSGMLFALDDEDVTVDDQHHQLNPLIKLVGGESRLCGSSLDSWHPSKMLDSATSPMSDRERNAYASQPTAPDTWSQLNAPVPDRADPLFLTNNTKPQPREFFFFFLGGGGGGTEKKTHKQKTQKKKQKKTQKRKKKEKEKRGGGGKKKKAAKKN